MLHITINIVLDRLFISDVLKAILSTIFFHRLFGVIKPLSPPREILEITYPSADDPLLESLIDEKLAHLTALLDTSSTPHLQSSGSNATSPISSVKKSQICVSFHEKKTKKAWFSKLEEEVRWEEWQVDVVSVTPRNDSERERIARSTESQLQNIILKIIDIVNDHKDHIPPITTEGNPFPYQITIPPSPGETWGSVFKKILVE
ncbi:autophagy-related protein [Dipodascopsis uninucleata]